LTSTERPLLLGHRGARLSQLPENTLAAFDVALQAGCDGFEFDVRATRDRQLIIVHDARVCGLEVAGSTYAELQQSWQEGTVSRLPLTQRRSLNYEQLAIPCLQDVLQRYAGRAFLDIELKVEGWEDAVLREMRQHSPQRFLISSFLPSVLRSLAEKDSSLPLGLICESARQLAQWPKLPVSFVIPHYRLASKELVDDLHASGKRVILWTVNQEEDVRRITTLGVDGIVSDDPEMLARACW
jgi:glycerophosphoryl diester phosphodiesterase